MLLRDAAARKRRLPCDRHMHPEEIVSGVRPAGVSHKVLTAGTCAQIKPKYTEGFRVGLGGCECYSGGLAYYLGGVRSLERQRMRDINRLGGRRQKNGKGGGNKYTDDMIKKKVNGCVKLVKIKPNGGHDELKTNTKTLVNDPQTIQGNGSGLYNSSCVSMTPLSK